MPNALRLILFTLLFLAGQLDLCASLPKTRIGNFFPLAAEPRPEIALQVPELRLDNPLLYDESASGRLFWSKFDPEGLDAWSLTKAVVGAVVGTAADGAAFVGISLVNCAGPAKASYNPVDAHFNYQDNLWKELGFKTNPIRGTPAESKQLARAAEDGMFALHGTGFFRAQNPEAPDIAPASRRGSGTIGDVGTMGELKAPGAGTGLERHEIPSRAAQEAAFIEKFVAQTGRRPDPSEVTAAMKNNPAILIPPSTHAETDTYKNKNTKSLVENDSKDLDDAARRGRNDLQGAAKKTNVNLPVESARKLKEMQDHRGQ